MAVLPSDQVILEGYFKRIYGPPFPQIKNQVTMGQAHVQDDKNKCYMGVWARPGQRAIYLGRRWDIDPKRDSMARTSRLGLPRSTLDMGEEFYCV